MNLDDMSQLFDVDVRTSLDETESSDYSTTASEDKPTLSFEDRVKDVQSIMQKETEMINTPAPKEAKKAETKPSPEKDIIVGAMEMAKSGKVAHPAPAHDPEETLDIPGDIDDEDNALPVTKKTDDSLVENDIAEFAEQMRGTDADAEEFQTETEDVKPEIVEQPKAQPEEIENPKAKKPDLTADSNPLGLLGVDLKAFHHIREKFPQFVLFDGSPAYRDFYRSKVVMLKGLLTRFPLLDISDLSEDLSEVRVDHFIGDRQVVTPDLIRVKLDDVQRARVRVSQLLTQALGQYFVWERTCEMLKSKLWKDHELKGAHRRDGLTLEHMSDMETYVSELNGFIESAKHIDNVLRAASDSLSRQLSCLHELKEPTGFTQTMEQKLRQQQAPASSPSRFEGLDTIDEGSIIKEPDFKREAADFDFGVGSDDLAELG